MGQSKYDHTCGVKPKRVTLCLTAEEKKVFNKRVRTLCCDHRKLSWYPASYRKVIQREIDKKKRERLNGRQDS